VGEPVIEPARVGLVGCGAISRTYLKAARLFPHYRIVACTDLDRDRAEKAAAAIGARVHADVASLVADPDVEVVLNLTVPAAHVEVAMAAIERGKWVYGEKPLALDPVSGGRVIDAARQAGVRVGSAPDTFLGAGLQTVRKLLDGGAIGDPVGASGAMVTRGHERWHPSPAFYYQPGGGPLFDMGPYYLTALISLLGPVHAVTGAHRTTFPTRVVGTGERAGTVIPVEVPTHVIGLLELASGPIVTLLTTFDVWAAQMPRLEIYGTEGSIQLPDPNRFGGPVRLWRHDRPEWTDVPLTHAFAEESRGIGLDDMAAALRTGAPHRASAELALHVVEVMSGIIRSGDEGARVTMTTHCTRPAPLPALDGP
jgi:predicted dehydrogenase